MWSRLPLLMLSLAAVVFAIWRSVLTLRHAAEPVYGLPAESVSIVLVAAAIALLAAVAMVLYGRPRIVFPVCIAGLVAVLTFFVFPTLGVLLLAALLVGAVKWWYPRRARHMLLPSSAAAASLALALPVLLVMGNQRPLVQCDQSGVEMNGPGPFSGDNSTTVASSSTSGGISRGTVTYGTRTYAFVCHGSRLVSFVKR